MGDSSAGLAAKFVGDKGMRAAVIFAEDFEEGSLDGVGSAGRALRTGTSCHCQRMSRRAAVGHNRF
jgi:hypothetical protein